MIIKKAKILIAFSCFVFVAAFGFTGSNVFAACPDGSDNCNITGEYQIDGLRALKVQLGNDLPRDIFIGDGAGDKNPISDDRAFGNILIGRHAGYSLEKAPTYNTIGSSTIIGDMAAENLISTVHNTYIGSGVNRGACTVDSPCGSLTMPNYNTSVGTLSGYYNIGSGNSFFGTEAGKYVTTGVANILIGLNAGAGHERPNPVLEVDKSVGVGHHNIHIGVDTEVARNDISSSIAIGNLTRVEDDHQIVVGSGQYWKTASGEAASCPLCDPSDFVNVGLLTDSYWGSGVTSVDPQDFSFNATGGKGDDVNGADLIIAGGKSTGDAVGGSIIFQTAPAGASSGDVQNSLVDRMVINSNGNVGISTGSSALNFELQINDSTGDNNTLLQFKNSTSGAGLYGGLFLGLIAEDGYLQAESDLHIRVLGGPQLLLKENGISVSGLPDYEPVSGDSYIVCVDSEGNLWVDKDGNNDCD